ncbi:Pvc16 family protein [uncultured Psychroserpens sp.]|uniref:Pvc16 family protein n=1 Tax=uncultured Psychroserpens sp. TaxID=255436 RepID=UPI002621DE86|nr:Pvc16 family protein [uncultured Psychroserpens sp.]
MIKNVFQFISNELEQYLRQTLSLNENHVVCNPVINTDGSIPMQNQNKVVLSLLNIQQEASRSMMNISRNTHSADIVSNQPEQYSINVLVTSSFEDYLEALNFLDKAMRFFQKHALISPESNPNLPEGLLKLSFEFEATNYAEMESIWTILGTKHQPCIIYKLRITTS